MKIFNATKLKRYAAFIRLVPILFLLRLPFLLIAVLVRPFLNHRPDILIADGFLIGDCVLARALVRAASRRGRHVVYLGGKHARLILGDMDVDRIEHMWPWAVYDYRFNALLRNVALLVRLLLLQPRVVVELRGDIRSQAVLFLACPKTLIGFGFTGGGPLLDKEPPTPGEVLHLEKHNELLALCAGLEYHTADILQPISRRTGGGRPCVGISFSGSQPLKTLPADLAVRVLSSLHAAGWELTYLTSPRDFFLATSELPDYVRPWKGSFEEYFEILKGLDGYVGMDSAGAHISAMFDLPVLEISGTMPGSYVRPAVGRDIFLLESSDLWCKPCDGVTCVNETYMLCYKTIDESNFADGFDKFIRAVRGRITSS